MSPLDAFRFKIAGLGVALLIGMKAMFDRLPRVWRDGISILVGVLAVVLLTGAYVEAATKISPLSLLAVCTAGLFFWMCWQVRQRRSDPS